MGAPHNYCLGRKETGRPRLLFHAAVPRLPALSLGRQRSPRPESKVRARGPAESSALERYARERPEHKAARSRPATAPGPGLPRAHGARANTMHPGLGRGSCRARPWDFLVNRSPTPRPHPTTKGQLIMLCLVSQLLSSLPFEPGLSCKKSTLRATVRFFLCVVLDISTTMCVQ